MGYLLREALKTLCGMNQWSYAAFWKIACQNPRLLIWEDCFYQPLTFPASLQTSEWNNREMPFGGSQGCSVAPDAHSSYSGTQSGDKIQLLINRMMVNDQICIIGEGVIGRAAFTGNYDWFLSNSFGAHAHPPEVSNEMQHQFSAGIQTVAVVPVPHHGVLQLGSSLSIMENLGFLNNVKSLILQLGCIPGALFSTDSAENTKVAGSVGEIPTESTGNYELTSLKPLGVERCKKLSNSPHSPKLINDQFHPQVQTFPENSLAVASSFQSPYASQTLPNSHVQQIQPKGALSSQVGSHSIRAEVIPPNLTVQLNRLGASSSSDSGMNHPAIFGQLGVTDSILTSHLRIDGGPVLESNKFSDAAGVVEQGELPEPPLSSLSESGLQNGDVIKLDGIPLFSLSDQLMACATQLLSRSSDQMNHLRDEGRAQIELPCHKNRTKDAPSLPLTHLDEHISLAKHYPGSVHFPKKDHGGGSQMSSDVICEDFSLQDSMGNDLFDIFGMGTKNEIFGGKLESLHTDRSVVETEKPRKVFTSKDIQEVVGDPYSFDAGLSDSGIFSMTGTDNLLDAVVSGARSGSKQNSDDTLSCKTTLTKISCSSVPRNSVAYGQSDRLDQFQGDSIGLPQSQAKDETFGFGSLRSGSNKSDEGTCSKSNSFSSQISSWVDQGHATKHDNSVLTAQSKRPDGVTKPNRKRLKPGESPRPRPKDRQLIQDRLKELRDIVPHGAKCSIDALLERTIKHMQFLQGVTKHADKLKHVGESRIINEKGRLLLKDKVDGGATYAFEFGSHSIICPIIVEDLNPPRQFLVEMLCEEHGFFLEIAEMIRGLGLTILTGVMESRNDKTKACFAVEANRDVTRMEIFMLLVHHFEETMKGNSMSGSAFNDNMMPHQPFQPTTIPAIGMQQ